MASSKSQAPGDHAYDVLLSLKEWLNVQEARLGRIASPDPYRTPPYRPSVAKRVFRTVAYGFLVIVISGAALAWYSSDDAAKDLVRASLGQLTSMVGTKSASISDAQPTSKSADQALVAVASSAELLQRQLETLASDIAVLRQTVEQLAAKQEHMARDIATVQEVQQNINEKLSSSPESAAAIDPPRNSVPNIVNPEAAAQPASVPMPIPRPAKPRRPN